MLAARPRVSQAREAGGKEGLDQEEEELAAVLRSWWGSRMQGSEGPMLGL